jgi:transcriptional regulator with XRE-family HTH domain
VEAPAGPSAPTARNGGLGSRLRQRRLELGLTQAEVAGERYTRAHVSRIENGAHNPSATALPYFAARLDVSAEFLLTGVEPGVRERLTLALARAEALLSAESWRDAASAFDAVLTDPGNSQFPDLELRARVGAARAHGGAGDPAAAIGLLNTPDRWQRSDDPALVARGQCALGTAYVKVGDWNRAARILESALPAAQEHGDPAMTLHVLSCLVVAEQELGNLMTATRYAERATVLADQVDDPRQRGRVLLAASETARRRGNLDTSLELAHHAQAAFAQANMPIQARRARLAAACLRLDRGDARGAAQDLAEAAALDSLEPPDGDRVRLQIAWARVHLANDELDAAEAQIQHAAELAQEIGEETLHADLNLIRAQVQPRSGHPAGAAELAQQALQQAPTNDPTARAGIGLVLIDALEAAGRPAEALNTARTLLNPGRPTRSGRHGPLPVGP